MRLGDEEVTEEHIQDKLDQVFKGTDAARAGAVQSECHFALLVTRSRISLDSTMREKIKRVYESDSRWADIVTELRSDPQKNLVKRGVKDFRLSHDCLEIYDREGPEGVNRWRLVIPDIPEVKKQIMEEVHAVPYSGHVGYQKTLKKIQQNFYWPDHTLDIREFVTSCPVCQVEKSVHRQPAGLLQPLQLPDQKWADVSLDFIMGLPKSESGRDGILTVVDRATKMVHLIPVYQTITAAETARVYWDYVGKHHGIPRSIVSDRDPRFVSRFWQEFWRLLGSKLRMSTAHHPQTDGQTEAVNRVVEMTLRCTLHASQEPHQWEKYLSMAEFTINNTSSTATGYTPFFLNYGYHPCTPAELLRDINTTFHEGVNTFVSRMQKIFTKAHQYLRRAQDRQKRYADQRRREQVFHTGDQVLLSTENLQLKNAPVRKLKRRFIGPFFINQRIGPVAYELKLPSTWKIHPVFHTSLLRPFKTSQWTSSTEPTVGELEPEDDEPYDVERLLRWRWRGPSSRRQKEFLVL